MNPVEHAAMFLAQGEVLGCDDHSIGKVSQIYIDSNTDTLTWVTVKTRFFGNKEFFIPLDQATFISNIITVPYDRAFADGAPKHEFGHDLSAQDEDELCLYYQMRHHAPSPNEASDAVHNVINAELAWSETVDDRPRSRKYVLSEQQYADA